MISLKEYKVEIDDYIEETFKELQAQNTSSVDKDAFMKVVGKELRSWALGERGLRNSCKKLRETAQNCTCYLRE